MEPSVWLIAGPTASGKSALALRLAEQIGGEVVNADSMQLYADLSVLSARPGPADTARAPHHLYGVADAAEAWSVGRWLAAARAVLDEIAARGRPVIVAGGTGLYFRALTQGLAELPPVPPSLRATVEARYANGGEAAFRAHLRTCDPAAEARIQPGDRQRLIRALSVVEATGRALSDWQTASPAPGLQRHRAVVLDPPRPVLYARCDARLAAMAQGGGVEEAQALAARGLSPALPAMKALGVREFADAALDRRPLGEALADAQTNTRRYAKRQATWFRNQTPDWSRIEAADAQGQWAALAAMAAEPA